MTVLLLTLLPAGAALAVAKPGKPAAKAPKGTIATSTPTFSWGKARGAKKYELRVSKGSKVVLKKTGLTKLSYKAAAKLPAGVGLSWKVRAVNASGAGAWSASLAFKVATISSAKAITAFGFPAYFVTGVIVEPSHTISVQLPFGTPASALTSLAPTIAISGVSVSPASGVARDFSSPVTYTVAGADGTTQAYTVTVTIEDADPGPHVAGFSPNPIRAGATLTLTGDHLVSGGQGPDGGVVYISVWGRQTAMPVTASRFDQLTVAVPASMDGAFESAMDCTLTFSVGGRWVTRPSCRITDLKPWHPTILDFGDYSGAEDDAASPGDHLRVYAEGVSPVASANVVRFGNGVTVAADSYTEDTLNKYRGILTFTVPQTAASGTASMRRGDGLPNDYGPGRTLGIYPLPNLTIDAVASFPHGIMRPCYSSALYDGQFIGDSLRESWVLRGSGFSGLQPPDGRLVTNYFVVDVTAGGQTLALHCRAVSDTLAVLADWSSVGINAHRDFFRPLALGTPVSLRARGYDPHSPFIRTSPTVTTTLSRELVYGSVSQTIGVPFATQTIDVAKGDVVQFAMMGDDRLTSPLWTGEWPLKSSDGYGKLLPLDTAGTFAITDLANGHVLTVNVHDGGTAAVSSFAAPQAAPNLPPGGLEMAFGGGTVTIPAGALPDLSGTPAWTAQPYYQVTASHVAAPGSVFHDAFSDGGMHFSLQITPEPPRLLKPITIKLPYDPATYKSAPFLGIYDRASGLYYDTGLAGDTATHTMTLTLPAQTYGAAAGATPAAAPAPDPAPDPAAEPVGAGTLKLPSGVGFKTITERLAPVGSTAELKLITDATRKIYVYYANPSAAGGAPDWAVSDAYAQEIMSVAQLSYDTLKTAGWSPPNGWIDDSTVLRVVDLGNVSDYKGSTTSGVFGQPWISINYRCSTGTVLDTAVAHEMTHVFQRQYTTNLTLKWIDEATANWGAWAILGSGADLNGDITSGVDFANMELPTGFYMGYGQDEAYAACALSIWQAQKYGDACIEKIYDALYLSPSLWYDSYAVFQSATGHAVTEQYDTFAQDFWMQTYKPVEGLAYGVTPVTLGDWTGVLAGGTVLKMSSERTQVGIDAVWGATANGKNLVAECAQSAAGRRVLVYGDTKPGTSVAYPDKATVTLLGTLDGTKHSTAAGKIGDYKRYWVVAINATTAVASPAMDVRLIVPHVASVSPESYMQSITDLHLTGNGFGTEQGTATVGGVAASVLSWADGSVIVRANLTGLAKGVHQVQLKRADGVTTDTVPFTVY